MCRLACARPVPLSGVSGEHLSPRASHPASRSRTAHLPAAYGLYLPDLSSHALSFRNRTLLWVTRHGHAPLSPRNLRWISPNILYLIDSYHWVWNISYLSIHTNTYIMYLYSSSFTPFTLNSHFVRFDTILISFHTCPGVCYCLITRNVWFTPFAISDPGSEVSYQ